MSRPITAFRKSRVNIVWFVIIMIIIKSWKDIVPNIQNLPKLNGVECATSMSEDIKIAFLLGMVLGWVLCVLWGILRGYYDE